MLPPLLLLRDLVERTLGQGYSRPSLLRHCLVCKLSAGCEAAQ
jgi:hypothetical protein